MSKYRTEWTEVVEGIIDFNDSHDSYILFIFEEVDNIIKFVVFFEDRIIFEREFTPIVTLSFTKTIWIVERFIWITICCC